jgi:hypothetical protein
MMLRRDDDRFIRLLEALESGWEIEEPVLIRATWNRTDEQSGVYHFVLRKKAEDKTHLLSLPPSAKLLDFLATNRISVTGL